MSVASLGNINLDGSTPDNPGGYQGRRLQIVFTTHLARTFPNANKMSRSGLRGEKGTFVIFACILGLGLTRTKLAARLKIQAKMTKVPFPP